MQLKGFILFELKYFLSDEEKIKEDKERSDASSASTTCICIVDDERKMKQ